MTEIPDAWVRSETLAPCPACSCLNDALPSPVIVRPEAVLLKFTSLKEERPLYSISNCCEFSRSSRKSFDSIQQIAKAWEKRRRAATEPRHLLTLERLDAYEAKLRSPLVRG